MRFKFVFTFFVISVLALIGCDSNEPEENSKLILTVEDASCTEAWLKISDAKGSLVTLKRDNKEIMQFKLTGTDTIVVDDSLLPTKTYRYQVFSLPAGQAGIQYPTSSIEVPVTTMDTTSHNFTWQSWEFGESESSSLYDVAIIDENNIWAVGEIYMKDSLGNPDPQAYNAIHLDGEEWELRKIYFPAVCGSSTLISYPIKSIAAFDDGKIFFTTGGDKIAVLGNNIQRDKFCLPSNLNMSINKIWGSNSENYFIVGPKGRIANYLSGSWQKIESGTDTHITDMCGFVNENNEIIIYCTVSSFFEPGDKKILKIKNNKVEPILWDQDKLLYSVWTNNSNFLYVCGSGAFENKSGYWKQIDLTKISMNKIRGNDLNDIFIVGDFGLTIHFNGTSWKTYNDLYDSNESYFSVQTDKNTVVLVGEKNGKGIITIGKRN